jgi:hypothetical protein
MGVRSRLFVSSALLLATGACATAQQPAKLVDIRPTRQGGDPDARPSDPLYQAAVSAIERRDYALALDALQAARARSPDDARVWNAMGVVYDKLGRFDLSARYYAQAEALDPGSRVVSQNLAYSEELQERRAESRALAAAPTPASVATASVDPEPRPAAPAVVAAAAPEAQPAIVEPAPAPRAVAQPPDVERAPRLAAADIPPHRITPALEPAEAAPAPPEAARVAEPAPAPRIVAQAPDVERAPRLAAASVLSSPAAPVFDPAEADAPAPREVARVADAAATPRSSSQPAEAERAWGVGTITEALAHLFAPVFELFASDHEPQVQLAQVVAPAAPLRTVVAPPPVRPADRAATAPGPLARLMVSLESIPATMSGAAPSAVRVASPTGRVTVARATNRVALLGRPLMVVNASGRRGGAEPVRLKLASRGWTAPVSVVRPGAPRATSTILYASRNVVVAKALARTLPYGVRLQSCGTTCRGVTLFVGADALGWKGGPTRMRTPADRARG